MTKPDIALYRLRSQQIEHSRFKQPNKLLAWLGAVQGQDYAGAKWSVGLRLPSSTDADIEQAISNNTILRTWAMRGTLHLVAAEDIRWLLALLAPHIITNNARRYRELNLDEHTLVRSNEVLAKALQGGKQLNRKALLAVLEQNGISPKGQRAAYMLQRASLDGLICQGVVRRNIPTFLSLDDVLPDARAMERDVAVAELAKRYFTSRAPATLQDFVWWSGLITAEARAGLEAIKSQLVHETIDGQNYWLAGSMPAVRDSPPAVYLLPGFDEYLLAYRDRSASIEMLHQKKLISRNGVFDSTIVVGGRVAGIWKRTFRKGAVVITPTPFTKLTDAEDSAFAEAAQRYGKFLDMPVILENT